MKNQMSNTYIIKQRMEKVKYQAINLGAALLVVFMLISCGNDDDMTNATISMSFKGETSVIGVPGGRVEANSLEFTSGTIRLREIQFEAEVDDEDSVEVNIEQIVDIDFATGATTPDLSALVFPIGTYREIEVELELQDENNDPSVVIEGTFTDANSQEHPIRFEFNSGETFEVRKEGQIIIGEGASVLAEVTFDPGVWFAEVTTEELSAAVKKEGVIVISETSNPEIFDIVADGLDLATEVEIRL